MVVVLIKSTVACVLLAFLCSALFSTARLHPAGGEVNGIMDTKVIRDATGTMHSIEEKSVTAIIEKNLKKQNAEQIERNCSNGNSESSSAERKRSLRTRLLDTVGGSFVVFTSDYHSARRHPPKNNK